MFASIGAGLEAIVYFAEGNCGVCIGGVFGNGAHRGEIKVIAFLFNVVHGNNNGTDLLGTFEVFKLCNKLAKQFAGFNDLPGKLNNMGFNGLDVVDIKFL